MADEDNLVTLTLLDREMHFHRLSQGQLLLMQRMMKRLRSTAPQAEDQEALGAAYSDIMVKILDVIDTLFVSETDRQDVEDAILQRKMDLRELMQVMHGKPIEDAEEDDADAVAAPKALKSKKAANATKKTATRRARS